MSEQLYFFKFNKEIARTKLSILIKKDDSSSYKQFLSENLNRYEEKVECNNIINKIDENIELLSIDELWSLFDWFSANYNLGNQRDEEMYNNGLDFFCEMPSKTPIRNFHELLGEYEFLTNQEIHYKCGSNELNGYINFLICYTGELMIFLNKYYYTNHDSTDINLEIEQAINDINSKSDNYFHNLALSALEKSRAYNSETIQLVPPLIEFRRANMDKSYTLPKEFHEIEERESKIINVANLVYIAIELKEKLKDYDGKIIRLHSL